MIKIYYAEALLLSYDYVKFELFHSIDIDFIIFDGNIKLIPWEEEIPICIIVDHHSNIHDLISLAQHTTIALVIHLSTEFTSEWLYLENHTTLFFFRIQ